MGKSSLFLFQNFVTSNRHTLYFEISFKKYPLGLNKSLDFFRFSNYPVSRKTVQKFKIGCNRKRRTEVLRSGRNKGWK